MADFLFHPQKTELAQKITPLIKNEDGTGIGIWLLSLNEKGITKIDFSKKGERQPIYDSIELNKSQCTLSNNTINKHLKSGSSLEVNNRSESIIKYKEKIQNILDDL